MKKTHLILVVFVAIIVSLVVATYSGNSTSVNFDEAFANVGKEYKISGTLVAEEPIIYDPEQDANMTTFMMADKSGRVQKVLLHESKPQGIEQSESIDLHGEVQENGEFHAHKILMKCPSKYNENKHMIKETSNQ